MSVPLLIARCVLAGVFAIAGLAKLADRGAVRSSLGAFGVPVRIAGAVSIVLPLAELVIAALLLVTPTARGAAIAALVLLGIFCAAIIRALARGERPDCNCFGRARSAPIGASTLVRNASLAVIAGAVAIGGPGKSLADALGDAPVWGLVIAIAVVLQAWFSWHLLRQQGRLIERVVALEDAARAVPSSPSIAGRGSAQHPPVVPTLEVHDRGRAKAGV